MPMQIAEAAARHHDTATALDEAATALAEGLAETMEAAELAPHQVKGALAISCAGCMLAVRPRMAEVVAELRAALPGVPFLGAFTFGEQGRSVAGVNLHGNLMTPVVVLG